jgi:hypothetical protein
MAANFTYFFICACLLTLSHIMPRFMTRMTTNAYTSLLPFNIGPQGLEFQTVTFMVRRNTTICFDSRIDLFRSLCN